MIHFQYKSNLNPIQSKFSEVSGLNGLNKWFKNKGYSLLRLYPFFTSYIKDKNVYFRIKEGFY